MKTILTDILYLRSERTMFHLRVFSEVLVPKRIKMCPFHITTPISDLSNFKLRTAYPVVPHQPCASCVRPFILPLRFSSQLAQLPKRAWSLKV